MGKNKARNSSGFRIRPLREEERELLRTFLLHSIFLPPDVPLPPAEIVERPELYVYIDGFGSRTGDLCMVAEADGTVVGAAWARIMDDYGHIGNRTPSLAVSLLPAYRNRGIGTALLSDLLDQVRAGGYEAVSLSVQKANRALHLYRRLGFRTVTDHGEELIMVRTFTNSGR